MTMGDRKPVIETRGGENPGEWVVAYDENGIFTLEKNPDQDEDQAGE
jgi:hypothetical protein